MKQRSPFDAGFEACLGVMAAVTITIAIVIIVFFSIIGFFTGLLLP